MRILPLVDESPELAGAVDVRVSYTRARRAMYLARAYAHPSTKKWAEALALERAGQLHIREARSVLSTLDAATSTLEPSTDNQETDTGPAGTFYPLPSSRLDALEAELAADALAAKTAWFAYNGGQLESAPSQEKGKHKKPLFFDIALNYVTLDMDALAARAGKAPTAPQGSSSAAAKSKNVPTSAAGASSKVSASLGVPGHEKKTAEEERAATPEPEPAKSGGGGLGGLLGGWWGRK
jgi:signal recognition particle subunit SRP68